MEKNKDLAKLGFGTKSPQRDLMNTVVYNALGGVHHTPLVGKELPSILVQSKDNLLELSITQILVQSPLASIQNFCRLPNMTNILQGPSSSSCSSNLGVGQS